MGGGHREEGGDGCREGIREFPRQHDAPERIVGKQRPHTAAGAAGGLRRRVHDVVVPPEIPQDRYEGDVAHGCVHEKHGQVRSTARRRVQP